MFVLRIDEPIGSNLAENPDPAVYDFIFKNTQQINELVGVSVDFSQPLGEGGYAVVYKSGAGIVKVTIHKSEAQSAEAVLADPELSGHPGVVQIYGVWPLETLTLPYGERTIYLIHAERLLQFRETVPDEATRSWIVYTMDDYREAVASHDDGLAEDCVDKLSGEQSTSELADFLRLVRDRTGQWPPDVWEENIGGRSNGQLALLDLGWLFPTKENPERPKNPLDKFCGGLPSGGGYECYTYMELAAQHIAEAAHCILGSIGKTVGPTRTKDWRELLHYEKAHLEEEIGIIRNAVFKYQRFGWERGSESKMNDPDSYYREYVEMTVSNVREVSPGLRARAEQLRADLEAQDDVPHPIRDVAIGCYDVVIALAYAMELSVRSFPNIDIVNPFTSNKLIKATRSLDAAVENLLGYAWNPWQTK
jgi:hypothetical protein